MHKYAVLCIEKMALPMRYVCFRYTKAMFLTIENGVLPLPFLSFFGSVWPKRFKGLGQTLVSFCPERNHILYKHFCFKHLHKTIFFAIFSSKNLKEQNLAVLARQRNSHFNIYLLTTVNIERHEKILFSSNLSGTA